MASFIVVVLEPGRKHGSAFGAAGEHVPVGPLGLQGSVEALDLAVLPGAVRFDELLTDAVVGADLPEREPIRPGIVGEQPVHLGDAVRGKVLE